MFSFELLAKVNQYIKDYYTGDEVIFDIPSPKAKYGVFRALPKESKEIIFCENVAYDAVCADESISPSVPECYEKIQQILSEQQDESFGQTLIRLIDAKGMTDSQCYNKAQMNRALFNRIKNNPEYNVQKEAVFALALALALSKEEADALLARAGYAFSTSQKADLIISFCIENKIYDVTEVNAILYNFDQKLLGSGVRD